LLSEKEKYAIGDILRYKGQSDLYQIEKIVFPYPFVKRNKKLKFDICTISNQKFDPNDDHYYELNGFIVLKHIYSFFKNATDIHDKKRCIMCDALSSDMVKSSLTDLCEQRMLFDTFIQKEVKRLSGEK
jgi:hypothetical protein